MQEGNCLGAGAGRIRRERGCGRTLCYALFGSPDNSIDIILIGDIRKFAIAAYLRTAGKAVKEGYYLRASAGRIGCKLVRAEAAHDIICTAPQGCFVVIVRCFYVGKAICSPHAYLAHSRNYCVILRRSDNTVIPCLCKADAVLAVSFGNCLESLCLGLEIGRICLELSFVIAFKLRAPVFVIAVLSYELYGSCGVGLAIEGRCFKIGVCVVVGIGVCIYVCIDVLAPADLVAEAHCHLVIDKIAEVAALVAPELGYVCAVVAGCGCIAGRCAAFIILLVRGVHDLVDVDRAVIIAIVCGHGSVAELNAALVGNADEHIRAHG